jgi:hypothetical protein
LSDEEENAFQQPAAPIQRGGVGKGESAQVSAENLGQNLLESFFEGRVSLVEGVPKDCAGIFITIWGGKASAFPPETSLKHRPQFLGRQLAERGRNLGCP